MVSLWLCGGARHGAANDNSWAPIHPIAREEELRPTSIDSASMLTSGTLNSGLAGVSWVSPGADAAGAVGGGSVLLEAMTAWHTRRCRPENTKKWENLEGTPAGNCDVQIGRLIVCRDVHQMDADAMNSPELHPVRRRLGSLRSEKEKWTLR